LISDAFLRTHCFETKPGRGETEGLIGLAFTPARDRTLPDITGTLWIDRGTAMLHHLDFTYVRLPQELVASRAGGRLEFMRVPSGAWIVRDWVIRMPVAQVKHLPMAMGTELAIVKFQEVGGNVLEIKTRSGTIVYRSESASEALAATPASGPLPAPATSAAAPTPAPASAPVAASTSVARNRNPDVIEGAEIEALTALDAYALVQEARPTWLHSRGTISIRNPSAGVLQVYLNGNQFGDVNRLREIRRSEIRELRFLGAADAELRYGVGHAGGVIEVLTK